MSIEQIPENDAPTARKMVRKHAMLELVGLSYPKVWRMMRDGQFPLPVKLCAGKNAPRGWFEDEIISYQESLERAEFKPADEAA